MTPEEFEVEMREITGYDGPIDDTVSDYDIEDAMCYDTETDHVRADALMSAILASLGYIKGVRLFICMTKWYA